MHEYGVTQQIIKVALDAAAKQNAPKIAKVNLVVGEMSGFIGDSIQLYFDILSKNTPAEGAELSIVYIKPQLKCNKCATTFVKKPYSFDCPACDGQGEPSPIGKEFYVDSIEVI